MQTIIDSLASSELLAASDVNLAAYRSAYGRGTGCVLHVAPDVVWFYTGIPMPLFNGVVCANLQRESVTTVVESLQGEIDRHHAPAFWWIGSQSKPNGLAELLERAGLRHAGELPGMAVDLASLQGESDQVPGLRIQKVSGSKMQALWARVAASGTGFPDAATEALARVEASLTDSQYQAQPRYIGYLGGLPVATSALVIDAGVAGIYAVATLPQARGRGIGRQMTLAPLLEARQMGYRVGILQSSPMGYPIYANMGFQDVCTYTLYLQS